MDSRRTCRIACAALIALFFVSAAMLSSATAATVSASQADTGKTVSVMPGDTLVVTLSGQHNSGRYWRIDADLTPQLVLAGRTTKSVAVSGAPESTIFTFSVGAPGSVMFRATYAMPNTPRAAESDIAILVDVMAPQQ